MTPISGNAGTTDHFNLADMRVGAAFFLNVVERPERRVQETAPMSTFPSRVPDDLEKQAAVQAETPSVSLNEYITTTLAARVGARAEVERYFATRGARSVRGRAMEILARSGVGNSPRADDRGF